MSEVEKRKEQRRARLAELREKREKILAVAGPIRAERDALVAEYQPKERALRERLRTAEADLYDIDMEIAEILRIGA